MARLIGAELFKIRKRWMTWILLGIMVLFLCFTYLMSYQDIANRLPPSEMPPDLPPELRQEIESDYKTPYEERLAEYEQQMAPYKFPGAFATIFTWAQRIGVILLIILAASVVGNEYRWGTVKGILTRTGNRYHYLAAKVIALLIVALLGMVICLIIGAILGSYTTIELDGGISWDFLSISFVGSLAKMFGWTALSLLVYILLAIFLAVLGRSSALGIGGGIGYYFIVEQIIVAILLMQRESWLSKVPQYMLGQNVEALKSFSHFGLIGFSPSELPSALHAIVTLVIYCLVFVAISLYLFRQRDLTG